MEFINNEINNFPFTIKQIKYFIALVQHGQVKVAAEHIHISSSAITTAIKDLENHLQVDLFTRTKDGFHLTREGDIFLRHCYDIMSAVSSAHNVSKNLATYEKSNLNGTLKIGCTEVLSGYLLAKLVSQFQKKFPNINLYIKEFTRNVLEKNLANNKLDVALIITDNIQDTKDLFYEVIISSPRNLWVPDNHKFLNQSSVTLEDVAREPFIRLTFDEAKEVNQQYWKNLTIKPNIIFESKSLEAIRSMVSEGMGITILSDMVYRPWSVHGKRIERIDRTKLMIPVEYTNVGIAWSRQYPTNEAAKEFIAYCKKYNELTNF